MLVSLHSILKAAKEGHYAVGAFNCLSLEHAIGAIQAAEMAKSPIIIQLAEVQFHGAPIELMAPIFLSLAKRATVPVTVHLDHAQSLETCVKAIKLGFNSVMFDGAALPFDKNVEETCQVVRIARAAGVDVEAELGRVGDAGTEDEGNQDEDVFTSVEDAKLFVEKTGVDCLAIAIGNLHGNYIATPKLNIERLKEISAATDIPLVLHGGSGTSDEDFKACIHNGICKINVATALQVADTIDIEKYLAESKNPNYIGLKSVIVKATQQEVLKHMILFESVNKAYSCLNAAVPAWVSNMK